MIEDRFELTDETLGAYVDGELDADAAAGVEKLISNDAPAQRRLAAIRKVTRAVRAVTAGANANSESGRGGTFRTPLYQAVPEAGVAHRKSDRRFRSRKRAWSGWHVAAAFVAGVVLLLGVVEIGNWRQAGAVDWREDVLAFHDMYLRAKENGSRDAMLEILSSRPQEMSRLIDFAPSVPDLTAHGYGPAGAHLLSGTQGPVVYVLFESEERPPIGFAMTRREPPGAGAAGATLAVHTSAEGASLVSWSAGPFEYGLGGQVPASELMPIAETVRSSLPTNPR